MSRNICKVDGCNGIVHGQKLCSKHYSRFIKYGNPLYVKYTRNKRDPICIVEECYNKHKAHGYCDKHLSRLTRHGDLEYTGIKKHYLSKTSEYKSWSCMKERCYKANNKNYNRYGGRGITVCDRWRYSFINFYHDMGKKPFPKAQIDRINNNGNYEPSNCRWVTQLENIRNSTVVKLTMEKAREIRLLDKESNLTQKKYR